MPSRKKKKKTREKTSRKAQGNGRTSEIVLDSVNEIKYKTWEIKVRTKT